MKIVRPHTLITIFIALVWFINGFLCKILNVVPRHEMIVSRILGGEYSALFTKAIGGAEILMAIWVLSGIKSRFAAVFQMVIIAVMNILEFFIAPDLLLFGQLNIVFASFFIVLIWFNEFKWKDTRSDYIAK